MVDNSAKAGGTVGEKLEEIKRACGLTTDTELADLLGLKTTQVLHNWKKRNRWTSDATTRIPERTGASSDWLLNHSAVAFPNGVKVRRAAPLEKRVQRVEADIDQARGALAALFAVLNEKLPGLGLGAAYATALEAVAPSEGYAEKGFHGLLSAYVETLSESAAAAPAPARSREARLPSVKKGAK